MMSNGRLRKKQPLQRISGIAVSLRLSPQTGSLLGQEVGNESWTHVEGGVERQLWVL